MNKLPENIDQLGLFRAGGDGIEAAFWKFHEDNPKVYQLLVKYARQAKNAGQRRFGIGMIWERLRWYTAVETRDETGLKLNNNHRSRYARLLMQRERCSDECQGCEKPRCLAGMFEIRELDQPTELEKVSA